MWQPLTTQGAEVYGLLSAVRFPYLDHLAAAEAIRTIQDARCLVWQEAGVVVGWIGLAHKGDNVWEVDIAIHPRKRGKWASKKSLRHISEYIFTDLGAKAIIGVCFTAEGMKTAHRLGFEMMAEENRFILTAERAKERYM
jgi:RimJ/RimL family protein N-acetyltransferase